MGNKLQQIHYARVCNDVVHATHVQCRRDNATANIQLRIMRNLVNRCQKLEPFELDALLHHIDVLPSDWRELVATLNVTE